MKITTIGIDLAKSVFQVHGVDDAGQVIVRKKLRRGEVLTFSLPRRHALSEWKPALRRTTGLGRSRRSAIKCG